MTPCDVMTIFWRMNAKIKAATDPDHACAGSAGWLAGGGMESIE